MTHSAYEIYRNGGIILTVARSELSQMLEVPLGDIDWNVERTGVFEMTSYEYGNPQGDVISVMPA